MKTDTVTVLDIGSTKVCCCIASVSGDGRFSIIGVGHCVCFGVKAGVIVDMESTEKSVAKAVESAEKMANTRVRSVYVSISGTNITSRVVNFSANIGGRIIQSEDIMRLLSAYDDNSEYEVVHSIPLIYTVDSLNGIKDPVGMVANHFGVSINLVTVSKIQLHNILVCLARCHLNPIGIVASSYASGLYVMDEDDVTSNQIIIEFGGGTTSVSFFYNGVFCGTEFISVGGRHITKDIAYGLNISMANAERLKTLQGAAFMSREDERDMIFAPVMEDNDVINLQQIPKSLLNQIIQSRAEEILGAVKKKIDESVFKSDFSNNVIITGGGSQLTGLRDFTSSILNKKVKSKKMDHFRYISEINIGPDFSVALGMIKFSQLREDRSVKNSYLQDDSKKLGFIKKTLRWIENNL